MIINHLLTGMIPQVGSVGSFFHLPFGPLLDFLEWFFQWHFFLPIGWLYIYISPSPIPPIKGTRNSYWESPTKTSCRRRNSIPDPRKGTCLKKTSQFFCLWFGNPFTVTFIFEVCSFRGLLEFGPRHKKALHNCVVLGLFYPYKWSWVMGSPVPGRSLVSSTFRNFRNGNGSCQSSSTCRFPMQATQREVARTSPIWKVNTCKWNARI